MGFITGIWDWYWNGILNIPLDWMFQYLKIEVDPGSTFEMILKIIFTIVILFIIYEVVLRSRAAYRKYIKKADKLSEGNVIQPGANKDSAFAENLQAIHAPEQTIAQLKRQKKWSQLGDVYVMLNRHKEAAKAYMKAKDLPKAAMEWAKAGYTVKAARLLQKAGDHATAARFYLEKGKFIKAAAAFTTLGDLPGAAAAYHQAKKPLKAAELFTEFFAKPNAAPPAQLQAAESCYQMLNDEAAAAKLDEATRKALLKGVADRFDAAQKNDIAAKLFRDLGDLARAGAIYLRAGKLEEAAKCMQAAGKTKEAAEIGGKYYESIGRFKEAGMAYEGAGLFRKAGDCFSKCEDAPRAAQNYEKGGEFYGAGYAYIHVREWEKAIPMFQKVQETDKHYAESRMHLGRCFYQLKDYGHCVAALENHLTGEKVRKENIDYFWMLALALEQTGELTKSKAVLQKIRTVDVGYRDVAARLSNIESRISMFGNAGDSAFRPGSQGPASGQPTAVMSMVENQIGERYKLERELGRGGMGVVYLAQDTQLDRPVALKFLGSLVDGSEEYKQRFQREAKAAAKVSHPNIVAIYDIGTKEGRAYIAMEYIEGINLLKYIQRKGKLEPREAVNLMGQVCSALEAVHAAGIIHRDIKPDNIVISKGGLVKLMDFGLAKSHGMNLTGANVIMGTPCYMSPEQVRGEQADARADIYALGLVLHEMLTGKTVFLDGDVLKRQLEEMPPPPGESVEGIPQLLDQLIMKCIAKKPEDRVQTVKELLGYLRQIGK